MLVRFQDPYTNAWKQIVTLLGEYKITIHQDLRNVLVLPWVVQAAKITMQNVADKEIHTLEKWDAASMLARFQDPYTNVLKQTVIRFSECKITIPLDFRNVFVLLCVGPCWRKGTPYTGQMRKCVVFDFFSKPTCKCLEI